MLRTVAPIFVIVMLLSMAAASLMMWATHQADRVSDNRQLNLVNLVLSQLRAGIAHDQESVSVWDDAVTAVRNGDQAWMEANLGSWMQTYFGHDGSYVLDPHNARVYSYPPIDGAQDQGFSEMMSGALPLVQALRAKERSGDTEGLSERVLTHGVADFVVIAGHPAVISVKPIVSDTGEIEQAAGEEYVHIALRYLDSSFIADLKRDYLLTGLRFSWADLRSSSEISSPLVSSRGETVGHFIWQPDRPGTAVLVQVAPLMVAVALAAMTAIGLLITALRRRSLNLSQSEATVRHLAHHDLLTGLPNRGTFNDRLDNALASLVNSDETIAILYLDLDGFKEVNDTFGHPSGDELLREFSVRLKSLAHQAEIVARMGGDEFTILLRRVEAQEQVEALCQRIVEMARHPYDIAGTQVFIGVSIGVALSPRDGADRVELTRKADVALYHCKRAGRSAFAVYTEAMDRSINARRDMERDLRVAIDDADQIVVHYQPLYSATAGRVTGVEALVRWRHPQRGLIAPDVFIPIAEETGLISRLGMRVLRNACKAAAGWTVDTIAVNVSALELRNPAYAMQVANELLASGLNPRRLELEVTESALSDKGGECERNVAALRELGVRFALDDFGTGFSSLGRLHQLEVDRIKIDRSFVQGFGKQNGDEAIVQAIVDLARATGLKTTAEGVETAFQSDYLKTIGCDELQGFLLARPLPPDEISELLEVGGLPAGPRIAKNA
jgi:diguanylate cyclase (GGDEF)-like protein